MSLEPIGAGAVADSGTWEKIGAVSTLKIVSGTQTIDAVRMTVRELTYGVTFSFTVARKVYDELGWQALAGEYAAKVEAVGSFAGTQGITYIQDVNGSQELVDELIVTVGTDDGLVSVDVEIPLATADSAASAAKYVNAYNAAVANLATLT